jgi:hypothetical protein
MRVVALPTQMSDYREHIKQAIDALKEERRESLTAFDQKIANLQAILDGSPIPTQDEGEKRPAATRGQAEREILDMLAGGGVLTAADIGRARGTTGNAASNVLRRLAKKGRVADLGGGRYQNPIFAPKGAQGSLPVDAERDERDTPEVGGS